MAAVAARAGGRRLAPMLGRALGLLVVGALAVTALPQLAEDLPHPGRSNQARYALACLGVTWGGRLAAIVLVGAATTLVEAALGGGVDKRRLAGRCCRDVAMLRALT